MKKSLQGSILQQLNFYIHNNHPVHRLFDSNVYVRYRDHTEEPLTACSAKSPDKDLVPNLETL